MKKIILFLIAFFVFSNNVSADNKIDVTFSNCVDGDTAKVILNKKEITLRFLAIDTPETKHPKKGVEPYGKEASNYTCGKLTKANKIQIEYDNDSEKTDKYNRELVWIFVDDELLQQSLIEKGFAKVAYLYGNYKYTSILKEKQIIAKNNQLGIWSNNKIDYTNIIICFIGILIIITLFVTNKNCRKKITRKMKNKTRNELKKLFK